MKEIMYAMAILTAILAVIFLIALSAVCVACWIVNSVIPGIRLTRVRG